MLPIPQCDFFFSLSFFFSQLWIFVARPRWAVARYPVRDPSRSAMAQDRVTCGAVWRHASAWWCRSYFWMSKPLTVERVRARKCSVYSVEQWVPLSGYWLQELAEWDRISYPIQIKFQTSWRLPSDRKYWDVVTEINNAASSCNSCLLASNI